MTFKTKRFHSRIKSWVWSLLRTHPCFHSGHSLSWHLRIGWAPCSDITGNVNLILGGEFHVCLYFGVKALITCAYTRTNTHTCTQTSCMDSAFCNLADRIQESFKFCLYELIFCSIMSPFPVDLYHHIHSPVIPP
jgi:hypothetical protein